MKKLLICLLGASVGLILLIVLLFQQKNPRTEVLSPNDQSPAEKLPDLKYYDGDDWEPINESKRETDEIQRMNDP